MAVPQVEELMPTYNPLNNSELLQPGIADDITKAANPQADILPGDSATTKAEKIERHGVAPTPNDNGDFEASPSKRRKIDLDDDALTATEPTPSQPVRVKGVAPIKKEFLVDVSRTAQPDAFGYDDDAAEASGKTDEKPTGGRGGQKTKGGQNHNRQFGSSRDAIELCKSRTHSAEFEPVTCRYGEKCRYEHDIRRYLTEGKREDLETFGKTCPLFEGKGRCPAGWRCRFAKHHSKELEREDGRRELVQVVVEKEAGSGNGEIADGDEEEAGPGVVNLVSHVEKIRLRKKQFPTPKADRYTKWLNTQNLDPTNGKKVREDEGEEESHRKRTKDNEEDGINGSQANGDHTTTAIRDRRAQFVEAPFRASEKRRIYYGPETPVLAPLTTQGNLPFRRLCVSLGAQITWSEMAMGVPLLQGDKGEWALMKAHESELTPPAYTPTNIVRDYNNSKDLKFGAQIAANKPWLALKTTEVLTNLCPHLRAIDLNCGCPLELVCRQGAGSSLLDVPAKLEKTLRGMNAVSDETPITVKIRTGTRDKQPTAEKLCQRLILGGPEAQEHGEEPAGVAAITLHGRSKQQRYTRSADWDYIASCAALIKNLKAQRDSVTDTVRAPDPRDLSASGTGDGLPYFCGNGDILSHTDYTAHLSTSGVDGVMIGRGALIKPWLFEEIAANQYLDKSASERLTYIEQFVRHGLEYWGSDEIGVGTTRRFLLEWLSFSCRYIPLGILEYLPQKFGDRPPAFTGRSDLETLLCSGNYRDWIKISEMFLGPAHKDFRFQPKHKSNSYEIEAEG